MPFGQIVIGPPGSGKTTYCHGMQEFLNGLNRPTVVVNLDPANEVNIPYKCDIDIKGIVCLENVIEKMKLGPNGGLVYCLEYLEKNIEWLLGKLKEVDIHKNYFLFDLPGQVELFTSHTSVRNILNILEKKLNFRFTVVNLVDSLYCLDATNYISTLMVSLSTMLHLEYPHVNVLSKIDLLEQYGKLEFDLTYYTEVQNLKFLLSNPTRKNDRNKRLNEALSEVIENYDNVCYKTLNIQNKESVYNLVKIIDAANGYIFGLLEKRNEGSFNAQQSVVNMEAFFDEEEENIAEKLRDKK